MDLGKWCEEVCNNYMLFGKAIVVVEAILEDSGKLDVGLDHNHIWSEIIWGRREVRRRERYKCRVDGKLDWEEYQEAVEEAFIGWDEEVRELEKGLGGGIVKEVWSMWKVIAAAEKGIGRKKVTERSEGWWLEDVERLIVIRKKVTERSEGWWSEDVERLIVIRKMMCRKLREERKRRVGVVTLSQLWKNYRRTRKEVKKSYHEREEGIEEENSEED